MTRAPRLAATLILAPILAACLPGCQFGARRQLDECRRLSQTLRSQNDQLKDQMLAYRNQNEDFSERAVDDSRRLDQQAEAIERLERSVQAYQAERDELQAAFRELRDSLPAAVRAASAASEAPARAGRDPGDAPLAREYRVPIHPRPEAENEDDPGSRAGWAPAVVEPPSRPAADAASP
jgi:hypothetical protein